MLNQLWKFGLLASLAFLILAIGSATAQKHKPNILVIMADDIMMGYRTLIIDRIANEGTISPTTTASNRALLVARRSSLESAAHRGY